MRRSSFLKTALSLVFAGKVLDTVAEAATPLPPVAQYPLLPGECYTPDVTFSNCKISQPTPAEELKAVSKYSILMTVHKDTGLHRSWYVAENRDNTLDLRDVISGESYIVFHHVLLDKYHIARLSYNNSAGEGYISKAR
jgi:hypothetical protein